MYWIYAVGQFKDDQLQNITGYFEQGNRNRQPNYAGAFKAIESSWNWYALDDIVTSSTIVNFDSSRTTRGGTTTHGKQKGVKYIIKTL